LAAAAASASVGIASIGLGLLRGMGARYIPRADEIVLGGRVLWLLVALTVASAALFGLVPALQGSQGSADEALRSTSRSATASAAARRVRQLLVGSQFAIATPLLVAAGLLIATLNALSHVDLGFDGRHVISGTIQLPTSTYDTPERVTGFWDALRQRVEA